VAPVGGPPLLRVGHPRAQVFLQGGQIELLELDKSGIHVAEYLTSLPPRAVLGERLQQATERARLQIEQRKTDSE
jgi:hypothetical protein